jgi:hypothetical protein
MRSLVIVMGVTAQGLVDRSSASERSLVFLIIITSKVSFVTQPLYIEYLILHGPHAQQLLYCCVCIHCHGNMFTEPLPSNCRLF